MMGLAYNMLSKEPFTNQRIHATEVTDDYTISNYVSYHFGMLIGERITCISWHENKRPKVLNDKKHN